MKYVIAILLVSFLFITACSSIDDWADDNIIIDPIEDDLSDDEIIEDIMPDLVDPDEDIEIGEMI